MNMIEKVAITLCETRTWPGAWQQANDVEKDACRFEARAVIEIMREPTQKIEVLLDRQVNAEPLGGYGKRVWQSLITAALESK